MAKLKRHEIPENTGINITPLLDVIFLLLVFFVLTSSIVRPNQIELELPKSTSGVKAANEQTIVITYRLHETEPVITLNAKSADSLDDLETALKQIHAGGSKMPVDIQIDQTVPYQDVIAMMDTVRDAGFPKFSLLTLAKVTTTIK